MSGTDARLLYYMFWRQATLAVDIIGSAHMMDLVILKI